MQIRQVSIRNFRGIKKLHWTIETPIACLIGPGNATKSTILDAIEFALLPRWISGFSDADFYNREIKNDIEIEVIIGQLPDEIIKDSKFGLFLQGWSTNNKLQPEPENEHERVIKVTLTVDSSLEPEWKVSTNAIPEGKPISIRDRERLGIARLQEDIGRHIVWGKGSALMRLTGDTDEAMDSLRQAYRLAMEAFEKGNLEKLAEAASLAQEEAKKLGAHAQNLQPLLDAISISAKIGNISLHEGNIPLSRGGLGDRRLVAFALQKAGFLEGSIILVDEIEIGLEPHRIRHLISTLHPNNSIPLMGQIILTTHSPIVVETVESGNLYIVRSANGHTSVQKVGEALQDIVRSTSEGFLANKVVVCEGKTEVGFCLGLEGYWASQHNGAPLAHKGVALINGGGDSAVARSRALANLGFTVAYYGDSDNQAIQSNIDELSNKGVRVIQWADDMNLESRCALDLPANQFKEMVDLALSRADSEQSFLDSINANLGTNKSISLHDLKNNQDISDSIRRAFGVAAHKKGWLKQIEPAKRLGEIVTDSLSFIPDKDLALKVNELGRWCYE